MAGNQTNNGKAFEFACLKAIYDTFQRETQGETVTIEESPQLRTARHHYEEMSAVNRSKLDAAGKAAIRVITRLEPQIHAETNVPLILAIQTDAQGISGDVRDVICIRRQNRWQIGLSCKHNHHAVKHSRLSGSIDFGAEWFGHPCSEEYFRAIRPLFGRLDHLREVSRATGTPALWESIPNKAEAYYVPVLNAFMDELRKLSEQHQDVPSKLIEYLVGRYDFYKVISNEGKKYTRVEAINISGTLNKPAGTVRPLVEVARIKPPSRFFHIGMKPGSDNTIELVCDEGWCITMRIHNASSRVEPSLKFDVQLTALPNAIYTHDEPW